MRADKEYFLHFQQMLDSKPNSVELENRLAHFYEELGWRHSLHFLKRGLPTRFPADYEPF
jgi:hypothetical protein